MREKTGFEYQSAPLLSRRIAPCARPTGKPGNEGLDRRSFRGALWTVGGFGAGQVIRFVSNIILTRLLVPQLFGLMAIVNTVRMGIELISDLGIGQNMIYSPNASDPEYYNTAWTLQIIRIYLMARDHRSKRSTGAVL